MLQVIFLILGGITLLELDTYFAKIQILQIQIEAHAMCHINVT